MNSDNIVQSNDVVRTTISVIVFKSQLMDEKHVEKAVSLLNSSGDIFEFKVTIYLESEWRKLLGTQEALHGYSHEQYASGLLEISNRSSTFTNVVAVTSKPLEISEFNKHYLNLDGNRATGIISIDGWRQYTPSKMELHHYLAYLLLCEAFCVSANFEFEDEIEERDLFDLCRDKSVLRECLTNVFISEHSRGLLCNQGFSETSGNRALAAIAKRSLKSRVREILLNPIVALVVAVLGLFGGLIISVLGSDWTTRQYVVSVATITVVILAAAVLVSRTFDDESEN